MTSSIKINNKEYSGKNISISNGVVKIDGKPIDKKDNNVPEITINVYNGAEKIDCDSCESITVYGDISGSVKTMSGDIECNNIMSHAKTMSGDVSCKGDITGNVNTMSGDITK